MEDRKYFFVCGPPKGGTTWVQHILDAHPRISCAGEGHFHSKIVVPLAAMMREYNRWQGAVDKLVYQGRTPYSPISMTEMSEVIRNYIIWLLNRRGIPGEVIWVGDKTPGYTEVMADLRVLFAESRFVHVIRDPRDVAVSRLFQRVRTAVNPNIAVAGDPLYYLTVDEVAQLWQQGSDRVKRFSADAPGVLHELRYEDLLERFHSTVQSVLEFFDVEASSEILAEIERRTRFEIMSGGRARGDADAGSFFRKGIAGDWRNHLDEKAISIIEVRCGALMDTYGYERAQRT